MLLSKRKTPFKGEWDLFICREQTELQQQGIILDHENLEASEDQNKKDVPVGDMCPPTLTPCTRCS